MQIADGLFIAEKFQDFGGIKLLRVGLLQESGDFQTHAHGTCGSAISNFDADSAAALASVEAADGNEGLIGKTETGKVFGVQFRSNLFAIDPGRAELLEGRFRAAADGDACILQYFQAGIEDRAFEGAEIGGGRNPAHAGAFKEIVAMPVFHFDDVKIGVDVIFGVEELRKFADGEGVADGDGIVGDEAGFVRVENGAFDDVAGKRIGAIEDKEGDVVFRGFFHAVAHGGGVGVEANAGVLNVENKCVNALQHVVGGAEVFTIEAEDGEASGGILGGRDFFIGVARDAVFGAEKRDQMNTGSFSEEFDGGTLLEIHAGVIGDHADIFATERGEFFGFQDVEAGLYAANMAVLRFGMVLSRGGEASGEDRGEKRQNEREGELRSKATHRFHSFQ